MRSIIISLILAVATPCLAGLPATWYERICAHIMANTEDRQITAGEPCSIIINLYAQDDSTYNHWGAGLYHARVYIWLEVGTDCYYWPEWTLERKPALIDISGDLTYEVIPPLAWPDSVEGLTLEFHVSILDEWGNERVREHQDTHYIQCHH